MQSGPGTTKVPARLHVLLARSDSAAVVLRRGPSKQVAVLNWDRAKDTLRLGQWLKGRIYEHSADISPDGRHWIYWAANHRHRDRTGGTWTAVAKTGWLAALDLYTYRPPVIGGGVFTGDRRYWMEQGGGSGMPKRLRKTGRLRLSRTAPAGYLGGDWAFAIARYRLVRDGWTPCDGRDRPRLFQRRIRGAWSLQKELCQGEAERIAGWCWERNALINTATGESRDCAAWDWADADRGDLLFGHEGCLWRQNGLRIGAWEPPKLVADLNDMTFQARRAPYAARLT